MHAMTLLEQAWFTLQTCTLSILIGLGAFFIGWRYLNRLTDLHEQVKLIDMLQGAMTTLLVFVLGLTLVDSREQYLRALTAAQDESRLIRTLWHELEVLGAASDGCTDEHESLRAYVDSIATDDWPALRLDPPALGIESTRRFQALRRSMVPEAQSTVGRWSWQYMSDLEHERAKRLQFARDHSPALFWMMVACMLCASCMLVGTRKPTRSSILLLSSYCLVVGLACSLIREYESPYRGMISIEPYRALKDAWPWQIAGEDSNVAPPTSAVP